MTAIDCLTCGFVHGPDVSHRHTVNDDMPSGAEQVYIMKAADGYRLYRSPDGRHVSVIDGPAYRTPREALRARQCEMARKVEMTR